ncbi:MAG: LapA family protein [Actinobacteria bacterium]|nr:MAG: LapA family protein [Actinomycetota bacterium]
MSQNDNQSTSQKVESLFTPKRVVALVIALIALIFVFSNTDDIALKWLWFTVVAPAWIMLLLVLLAGGIAGFALGRRRYKSK